MATLSSRRESSTGATTSMSAGIPSGSISSDKSASATMTSHYNVNNSNANSNNSSAHGSGYHSNHSNSNSNYIQQQQQFLDVPMAEPPALAVTGSGDTGDNSRSFHTPRNSTNNIILPVQVVSHAHVNSSVTATATTATSGGATSAAAHDPSHHPLTCDTLADTGATGTTTTTATNTVPLFVPPLSPTKLGNTNTHTTPNTVPKKSSSSARKVLSVAGRPLRSVGRRLTGRFQKSSNKRNAPETYGSLDMDDPDHALDNGALDNGARHGGARHGNGTGGNSSSNEDNSAHIRNNNATSANANANQKRNLLTGTRFVDSLRQAITKSPKVKNPSVEGTNAAGGGANTRGGLLLLHRNGAGANNNSPKDRDWIVYSLEYYLRHVCLLLGAYMLGVYHGGMIGLAHKLAEYGAVALVTCWVILVAASFQAWLQPPPAVAVATRSQQQRSIQQQQYLQQQLQQQQQQQQQQQHDLLDEQQLDDDAGLFYYDADEEGLLGGLEFVHDDDDDDIDNGDERRPLLLDTAYRGQYPGQGNDDIMTTTTSTTSVRDLEAAAALANTPTYGDGVLLEEDAAGADLLPAEKGVHPALDPFSVVDCATGCRIFPNAFAAYPLDTDYFSGTMMVLIRTPDVDDPAAVSTQENAATARYFTGKQRRFEFQFQLRLKKVPTGRVYFACELQEAFKMGMIQRAFVAAAMAFVKTSNSSFHYSMSGNPVSPDGKYENPHMAFPVEGSMDRVVATPPGQPVPTLGGPIYEDPESLKRRKKGGLIDWNLEDTYTMALWSAYVDFLDWRCINLPGIRPFDLCNVLGHQPIILTLYDIEDDRESDKHYQRDMTNIVRIEMCNAIKSGVGPMARQWMSTHEGVEDTTRRQVDDLDLTEVREESDEDAATLEELGEGIYVRSGDSITLRESVVDGDGEENGQSCYVTIGGGFAILQDRNSANIIIEKVEKSRSGRKSLRSKLIKSGDTVVFKLVTKGRNSKNEEFVETRYLTIHRGWWLKWVGIAPTKNGHFTIRTHETEFSEGDGNELGNAETQSSYLTLGGSFWLQHKRWKTCLVGVAAEGSATYGGRILGLYKPKRGTEEPNDLSDNEMRDPDQPEAGEGDKSEWMVPLQLRAYEGFTNSFGTGLPKAASDDGTDEDVRVEGKPRIIFSRDDHRMDVPAWLEIMNRTERIRQLTYVVRVIPPASSLKQHGWDDDDEDRAVTDGAFMRLRTGRDLAPAMRTGLNWRNSASPRGKSSPIHRNDSSQLPMAESDTPITPPPKRRTRLNSAASDRPSNSAYAFFEADGTVFEPKVLVEPKVGAGDSSDEAWDVDSVDEMDLFEDEDIDDDAPVDVTDITDNRSKSRKFIGKIAKSVKIRTASTGKTMVRQSVKVGKGTVNAGKAISRIAPIRPKNPPSIEPKSAKGTARKSIRRRERDLHVAVTRSMKRIEKFDSKSSFPDSPNMLAGQLSAPEQSCRTVSNMLSRMSDLPPSSPLSTSFSTLLSEQVERESDQDRDFLQGGAIEVGVVPSKGDLSKGPLISECLVARCLWESHWREEWFGVYEKGLAFYAPLSRSPCLELSFVDVQSVRVLDAGVRSPLPGYPILVIETAWLCHYAAFADRGARESFRLKIEDAMSQFRELSDPTLAAREQELWQARFWQGFQSSIESSLSSGKGKWAEVASGTKMKRRMIINNRRMVFDVEPELGFANDFVEDLLSTCLSFSFHSLKQHPEALLNFLDTTSKLRVLSLQQIDLASESAFCLFVNLYHCLLQHALLFSVNGPLHKKSFGHFMRTSCYEIGGDIFSLAEMHCCIIRGKMTRPVAPKPPYIDISKKSNAYRHYALSYTSPSAINFLLNTGDVSCPPEIPVLRPYDLDVQINLAAGEFLRCNVEIDESRRIIYIPKLCEVYRNDFVAGDQVGASNVCLQYCLRYVPEPMRTQIKDLLEEESSVTIKYLPTADQYHASLRLAEDETELEDIEIELKPSF